MESAVKCAIRDGHNVVLTGQAGTGKTHLLNSISEELARGGRIVEVTATTGIASTLIKGATTLHSCFSLLDGRYPTEVLVSRIRDDDNLQKTKQRVLNMDVLIVDEISMLSSQVFEQVEEVCRAIRAKPDVFGGIQVILCGDLYQLKPVPSYKYGDMGESILQSSLFTEGFRHHFHLTDCHRQKEGMYK